MNTALTSYPVFKLGQNILLFRPYESTDGPNPKLHCPWRGSYTVCAKLSPDVHNLKSSHPTAREISVHLAHLKPHYPEAEPPAPDFHKLGELFLGKPIPLPTLNDNDQSLPRIASYTVDKIVKHHRGLGRPRVHNVVYRIR